MTSRRVLILGGHGKVSILMTPLLLSKSWHVTSLIRNQEQADDIRATDKNKTGNLDILVASLEDVKSDADAKKILDQARPDYVVWSAGAGGKGGVSKTYAIDRDACSHFIRSAVATPSIKRFLLVSALICRRNRASWWSDADWASVLKTNTEEMPDYYKAKLAADEALTTLGEERSMNDISFVYVVLRPGILTDDTPKGRVSLGKTSAGKVTRADVADVAVRLLESGYGGWFDLVEGRTETEKEVERVGTEGVNSMDGESLKNMGTRI